MTRQPGAACTEQEVTRPGGGGVRFFPACKAAGVDAGRSIPGREVYPDVLL